MRMRHPCVTFSKYIAQQGLPRKHIAWAASRHRLQSEAWWSAQGFVSKEVIRAQYDGSLWYKLAQRTEKERQMKKAQKEKERLMKKAQKKKA